MHVRPCVLFFISSILLAILMLAFDTSSAVKGVRFYACLLSGLVICGMHRRTHWRSTKGVYLGLGVYIILLAIELVYAGIPEPLVGIDQFGFKGVLLYIAILLLPWIYIAIRILSIIFLIRLVPLIKKENAGRGSVKLKPER